jgi:lipid-A-disaccharide synthase-like uncharacterized protein
VTPSDGKFGRISHHDGAVESDKDIEESGETTDKYQPSSFYFISCIGALVLLSFALQFYDNTKTKVMKEFLRKLIENLSQNYRTKDTESMDVSGT